jgi:hypothetical protein
METREFSHLAALIFLSLIGEEREYFTVKLRSKDPLNRSKKRAWEFGRTSDNHWGYDPEG